jgi:hypothetical protein
MEEFRDDDFKAESGMVTVDSPVFDEDEDVMDFDG